MHKPPFTACTIHLAAAAIALSTLGAAVPLCAQSVRTQIDTLFTFGSCGELFCLAGVAHGGDFDHVADTDGQALIAFLGTSLDLTVSNTPISSASYGTTFKFEGGFPVKTVTSAGPIFAERALPLGRNRLFVGLDLTQMTFQRLRGIPMSALTFNYAAIDSSGSPTSNDIVSVRMALGLDLLVASVALTYGLADGVDVGITVPFERLSLHGTSVAQIVPAGDTVVHYFERHQPGDSLRAFSSADGASTGIGDLETHLKINIAQGAMVGAALFASVRFPTGDATNFLGSGRFAGRGLGIISARFGNFNPHLNLGYTLRDAVKANNSADAVLGFDDLLSQWATIAVDVLGSWQIGPSRVQVPAPVVYQAPAQRSMDVTNIPNQRDDLLSFNFGFKFRTRRGIQIVTSALFPLRNSAL
ncbi:MAG TPA: hypothetical protein VI653_03235, partial [Steroidobacteraceae bacterium]